MADPRFPHGLTCQLFGKLVNVICVRNIFQTTWIYPRVTEQNHIHKTTSTSTSKASTSETLQQGFKDFRSLKTGDAGHIQLVANVRKWVPGTIIEKNQ